MTDQDKLNNLYFRIKNFEFPECEDALYHQVIEELKEGFKIIENGLLVATQNIKHAKSSDNGTNF
ncbi:hypothetical protein [Sphingobacterium sp. LRF_L2]|uniref:hypothetical protein n=1 Tax=Sphingobacterium sp. LRF_L2 TaxID=3369421 RepID=UPI003F5FE8E7